MRTAAFIGPEERITQQKSEKFLMWLAIGSMVMLFTGLTSALVVNKGKADWFSYALPATFYISSAIILLSSVSMNWAVLSAKKGNKKHLINALMVTLVLGFGFVYFQFKSWNVLIADNVFFAGSESHSSGSFLYVLTGLHLAHLAGGLLSVGYTSIKAIKGKYENGEMHGVELCSIYWHFLDALWIGLFLFLLLMF
jgi:cytochrome c oxidase subunit III